MSKAKKPRLEIKVEPDSDNEYQEDISYIETNNSKQTNIETSNKVHVTQEEQEVLDREGTAL